MRPTTTTLRCSALISSITVALFAAGVTACNLVDDEPDEPIESGTDGSAGAAECLAMVEQVQSQCMPPQQLISIWDEGNSSMILVDDPAASIGIGPSGWLVQVNSAADYIGSYQFEGDDCTVGCGWCQPGQSLCHSGVGEDGFPGCMLCLEAGTPDPGAQCALILEACNGAGDGGLDETGDDGGLDETGSGVDEIGDDDAGETEGMLGYDCAQWDPTGAVILDVRGNAVVDATIIEEIAVHYGDPLADCDDTSFHVRSDGSFAISSMSPDGLLAQMGLQPGDAILAIDSVAMRDIDTIAATAFDLFLGSRVTSGFSLTIGRGREHIVTMVHVR